MLNISHFATRTCHNQNMEVERRMWIVRNHIRGALPTKVFILCYLVDIFNCLSLISQYVYYFPYR